MIQIADDSPSSIYVRNPSSGIRIKDKVETSKEQKLRVKRVWQVGL